jgi:hypothetical protein
MRGARSTLTLWPRARRAELQPKVNHIRMVATVGVHLRPLVDEVPAFGAMIVTLTKPPKLTYNIDLGAAFGKALGGGVEQFLNGLIPSIIEGFLVWPERIVVPILGEEVTGPLTDLMLRHKGIIKARLLPFASFTCMTTHAEQPWSSHSARSDVSQPGPPSDHMLDCVAPRAGGGARGARDPADGPHGHQRPLGHDLYGPQAQGVDRKDLKHAQPEVAQRGVLPHGPGALALAACASGRLGGIAMLGRSTEALPCRRTTQSMLPA